MGQTIGNIVKFAILCGGAYLAYSWYGSESGSNEAADFAQSACLDTARSRFNLASARVYEVKENSRGFVVRVSATLASGKPVKVSCVCNAQGGVNDIDIDER